MQLGIITPSATEQARIEILKLALDALSEEKAQRAAHLMRSWGVFRVRDPLGVVERALKRVQQEP